MELSVAGEPISVDAVLFDKDGTLIDLHEPWSRWAEAAIAELVELLPGAQVERLRRAVGVEPGCVVPDGVLAGGTAAMVVDALHDALPRSRPSAERSQAVARALAAADARVDTDARITALPGVAALLSACAAASLRIGVVTADLTARATDHLVATGLTEHVDVVIGADRVGAGKPDPEGVALACRELGVAPARAVFFGDSEHDAQAAALAGVTCVLIRPTPPPPGVSTAGWIRGWDEVTLRRTGHPRE